MAVVITSKFYQEAEWKDISKIVFTSPNLTSPSVAGTRSHILPGEGALGTWYEDTSEMFRIEASQQTTDSDYYNYRMASKEEVNLQSSPSYIDVTNMSYSGFDAFIKENTGVEVIGYEDSTGFVIDRTTRLEYTPVQSNLDEIHNTDSTKFTALLEKVEEDCDLEGGGSSKYTYYQKEEIRNYGWYTPVVGAYSNCHITFEFEEPIKLTAASMASVEYSIREVQGPEPEEYDNCEAFNGDLDVTTTDYVYFIGNYTIEGSNDASSWTSIYTGSNSSNLTSFVYMSNSQYYKYYRLNITNNSSLNSSTFDTGYYGVRALTFYTYQFSTEAGDDNVAVYEFSDPDNPLVFKISNAYPQQSSTPTSSLTNEDTEVEGTIYATVISGSPDYSSYEVDISATTDPYDYITSATCVASTENGTGTDAAGQTYTKEDKVNVTVETTVEFETPGDPNSQIILTAQGSTTVNVENVDWTGTADITYTTLASGTLVSGTNQYAMSGYTTRTYDATLYARRESYRLVVDELTSTSGIIAAAADLYVWGYNNSLDMDVSNSIVFEVTTGEAYDCRLTAWDDVTHSTTLNELIQGDHVRVSAAAYCCTDSKLTPGESKDPLNMVYPPAHNRILKGNVDTGIYKHFYGDFDLVYRYQDDVYGDYLIFKPMLYGIDDSISYGVHDFIITLHYSYT